MKTYKHIYEECLKLSNIVTSLKKTLRRSNKSWPVKLARRYFRVYVRLVWRKLKNRDFGVGRIIETTIIEGVKKKERHIAYLASLVNQGVMSVIFDRIAEVLSNRAYGLSYGSIPGRGLHDMVRKITRWISRKHSDTRYYIVLDIRKCFPSVRHDRVKAAVRRYIADKTVLQYLDTVIDSYPKGLPIGFLSSPWFTHILLSQTDFEAVKNSRLRGVRHYVRFMDDILIFGSNRRKLARAATGISDSLFISGLTVKPFKIQDIMRCPFDFCGIVFTNKGNRLRKELADRIKAVAFRLCESIGHSLLYLDHYMASLKSYNGWFKITDSFGFIRKYLDALFAPLPCF